jgi:hypothetical protein
MGPATYVTPSMKHKLKCNNFPIFRLVLVKNKLFKHDVGIFYNVNYVIALDGNLKLLHNIKNLNC